MAKAGMRATDIAVDGGALACASAGAGPALLLLHGWTLDRRMWAPQLARFAATHQVMALDRRGFGASSAPPDLAREADDVARVLDHFGAASAVVVGMSQAGRVALDFALRFPQRLSGLVLQGAPLGGVTPGPGPEETIPIVEYAALARAGRLDEMKRRWRMHALMHAETEAAVSAAVEMVDAYEGRDLKQRTLNSPEFDGGRVANLKSKVALETFESEASLDPKCDFEFDPSRGSHLGSDASGAASYLRDAEPQDLARIAQPALVITGDQDTPWRRRAGDALARALPSAQRVEIKGAGHLCNLERPDAYNAALAGFLARSD